MANGACFKHIAKIYASPARKVAVLPLLAIFSIPPSLRDTSSLKSGGGLIV